MTLTLKITCDLENDLVFSQNLLLLHLFRKVKKKLTLTLKMTFDLENDLVFSKIFRHGIYFEKYKKTKKMMLTLKMTLTLKVISRSMSMFIMLTYPKIISYVESEKTPKMQFLWPWQWPLIFKLRSNIILSRPRHFEWKDP